MFKGKKILLSPLLLLFATSCFGFDSVYIKGNTTVNQFGAATYNIPIEIPPGAGGLRPSLSLDYSSFGTNGLIGMGWSLSGLSAISRCPANITQDGYYGGVSLTSTDRFCLDGVKLIAINGPYGGNGTEYRIENENFERIFSYQSGGSGPTHFVAYTKVGQKLTFGMNTDSKVLGQSNPTIVIWALDSVTDIDGNFYEVKYQNDSVNGQYYPLEINYTGNTNASVTPPNSVKFFYASRPDLSPVYRSNISLTPLSRLSNIKTYANGTQVYDYQFSYQQSSQTGRTLLTGLNVASADGTKSLLPTTFDWNGPGATYTSTVGLPAFTMGSGTTIPANYVGGITAGNSGSGLYDRSDLYWLAGDFNGDGITDFIQPTYVVNGALPVCMSNFGGSAFNCTNFALPHPMYGNFADYVVGDYDGDGLSDFANIVPWAGAVEFFYSRGDGTFEVDIVNSTIPTLGTIDPGLPSGIQFKDSPSGSQRFFTADFDGDGRSDLFQLASNGDRPSICYMAGRHVLDECRMITLPDFSPVNVTAGDYDGDGRMDIAYAPANPLWTGAPGSTQPPTVDAKIQVCYSDGVGSFTCELKNTLTSGSGTCTSTSPCAGAYFTGDFNGDGVSDLAQFSSDSSVVIYFATGRGIALSNIKKLFANIGTWKDSPFLATDLNGDGKTDLITKSTTAPTELCYSRGNGDFDCTNGPSISDSRVLFGNFTGDATTSIVTGESTGTSLNIYSTQPTYPDLITSVRTGIGGKIDFTYKPLTSGTTHTRSVGSTYPIQDRQSPMWTVSSQKKDDGNGGQREINYTYAGAKFDLRGRGFLGFAEVNQNDYTSKVLLKLSYNQLFPFIGQPAEISKFVYVPALNKYMTATNSIYSYGKQALSGHRSFVFVGKKQDLSYDINTGALLTNNVVYSQYDNFGSLVAETTSTSDGYKAEKSFAIQNFTGDPTVNSANWYLGLVNLLIQKNTNSDGTSITKTVSSKYNSKRHLIEERVEPNNVTTYLISKFSYDSFGNNTLKSVSGSNLSPRTERTTYDSKGQFPIEKKNSYNQIQAFSYDLKFGLPASLKDPNNLTTKWSYDVLGRKSVETRPDGTLTKYNYNICTIATCGANKSYFTQTLKAGSAPQYVYFDILDREVAVQIGGYNGQWTYKYKKYDRIGNLQWLSNNTNGQPRYYTQFSYDSLNRLVTQTDPDGTQKHVNYRGLSTEFKNNKGQIKTETKNSIGLVVSSKDDSGKVTNYFYDPFANLVRTVDSKGNEIKVTYDILGHKKSKMDGDSGTWTYLYNAAGEEISYTDANGNTTSTVYDDLGRISSQITAEGKSLWVYDTAPKGVGKIAALSRDNGYSKNYSYDFYSRPYNVQVTMDTTYNMSTSYDGLGRVNKITYPTGFAVNYKYDSNGYLSEMDNASNGALLWKVSDTNADNNPLVEVFGNNVTNVKTYYPETGLLHTSTSTPTSGAAIQDLTLTYDSLGNLVSRDELINQTTGASLSETFSYDNLNRITSVTGPTSKSFSYDDLGNITTKSDTGSYTYGAGTNGNPIHGVKTITGSTNLAFTYDGNGNMLTGNGRSISWTSFNKPRTIANSNNTINFFYDANLERFKEVSTTCRDYHGNSSTTCEKYVVNPGTGIHFEKEINGTIITYRNYLYAGPNKVIGVHTSTSDGSNTTHYFHNDHLGTIALISDSTGSVAERFSYDAFGKRRHVDGSDDPLNALTSLITHQGFTLQEHLDDGGMGLIHMNGRVYDPLVARFISADPFISNALDLQSFDRYSYVRNNPLKLTDPSGFLTIGGFVGNLIGTVANGVAQAIGGLIGLVSSFADSVGRFIGSNPWTQDVVLAVAAVALIVVSGGTLTGAVVAVASVAGGAAVAAGAMAAFQEGDFGKNFEKNFHSNFQIGISFLILSALGADIFGGGIADAGGNGLNGYVASNRPYGWSLGQLDPNKQGLSGGMTIGPATGYSGLVPSSTLDSGFGSGWITFGEHEYGHTLQYIGLSALAGMNSRSDVNAANNTIWGTYLGAGFTGLFPAISAPWENSASRLGYIFSW
jgi:RHS repeat-associated protein